MRSIGGGPDKRSDHGSVRGQESLCQSLKFCKYVAISDFVFVFDKNFCLKKKLQNSTTQKNKAADDDGVHDIEKYNA
jgi:hypothetical protein